MAAKMLSVDPTVDPSAKLHDVRLGAYCEVGARTILQEVTMDDYSYVVNDAQITYTAIGKFCSIAAMTRINPGNHPMHRATQAHFTYRASTYFPEESDDSEFFEWRRGHRVQIGHDVWIGTAPSCWRAAASAPAPWSRPAPSSPRTSRPTPSSRAIRRGRSGGGFRKA